MRKGFDNEKYLKIQSELGNTLLDTFGLYLEILFVIKTFSHIILPIWSTKLRFLPHLTKQKKEKHKKKIQEFVGWVSKPTLNVANIDKKQK